MDILGSLNVFKTAASSMLKKSMDTFCFLETGVKDTPFVVAADGSIVSVIRIDGTKKMIGTSELNTLIENLSIKFASYLAESGHAMQFWFARDPSASDTLVRNLNHPARMVARNLNLELDDLFDERERHLAKFITWEGTYLALWTRPAVLTKHELDAVKLARRRPAAWPSTIDTQNLFGLAEQIRIRHESFLHSVVHDITGEGQNLRCAVLDSHDAIRAMRASIYPDLQTSKWRPVLPGDRVMVRNPSHSPEDRSHLFAPRLQEQLFSKGAEVLSPRFVRVGSYNFATLDMSVGPQEVRPFAELLNRMITGVEFPWRVSYLIEGNGLSGAMGFKATLASILAISNSENKLIKDAIEGLKAAKQDGSIIVRYRVSFSTWAPSDDLPLLEQRASQLQRAVESWGYCGVTSASGDPLASMMGTTLGMDVTCTAPAAAPPLEDVLAMLPWDRDASPWDQGSVLFRTPDGRPWPYEPGSRLQDTFIDLVFAPPGKSKSVFINSTNLALALSPSATITSKGSILPRIAIIDVGPSSSGLVSLIKEALPASRRHEAQYLRMRMIRDHAINPFDTQLGVRRPLPLERAFLINFLSLVGTPVGDVKPPTGLPDLIGMLVDEAYAYYDDSSRKGKPRPYLAGEDAAVDRALDEWGIRGEELETWWSVVDALFDKGDIHAASLAQRHAVPRLEDLTKMAKLSQVVDIHGTAKTANGEALLDAFTRLISSALREYPILTVPTRLDIGDSRIVSLDIDECAPKGGAPAEKQTSMVYMLARFVLARDFYLNPEVINFIPPKYRAFHDARIQVLRESPKKIVMDEFHRTKGSQVVRDQVLIDMREGRKWGVHICLASQLVEDFDEDMVDLATGIWIMGVNSQNAAEHATKLFGLSDTAQSVLRHNLNGPGPRGAPFLAILVLKDGRHEHLLVNTLGPMELWAFSTTPSDAQLRNRVYKLAGPAEGRKRLAQRFPGGSADAEIRLRKQRLAELGNEGSEVSDIIEDLAREVAGIGGTGR